MSTPFKKFKQTTNELIKYVEGLEAELQYVREGMASLLNEEDVTSLPSYTLLKHSYDEYLQGLPEDKKVGSGKSEEVMEELYDPMYMPPKMRSHNKKVNVALRRKIAEGKDQIKAKPKASPKVAQKANSNAGSVSGSEDVPLQRFATKYQPDFSEMMLGDDLKPEPTKRPTPKPTTPKPAASITVRAEGTVYKVEIQGKLYLRNKNYLYDAETKKRVGTIGSGFKLGSGSGSSNGVTITKTVTLRKMQDIEGGYYTDGSQVYNCINDTVAQAVGELTPEGDLALWT